MPGKAAKKAAAAAARTNARLVLFVLFLLSFCCLIRCDEANSSHTHEHTHKHTYTVIHESAPQAHTLDIHIHTGVHFSKLENKRCYNGYIPLFYNFDRTDDSVLEPEPDQEPAFNLTALHASNETVPLDGPVVNLTLYDYPLEIAMRLSDTELFSFTWRYLITHYLKERGLPFLYTHVTPGEDQILVSNSTDAMALHTVEAEMYFYKIIAVSLAKQDKEGERGTYHIMLPRAIKSFKYLRTGKPIDHRIESVYPDMRSYMYTTDMGYFNYDVAVPLDSSNHYMMIRFEPFEYTKRAKGTAMMLMMKYFSTYYTSVPRQFYFFREIPAYSKVKRGLLPFIGSFLNWCCSVLTENDISSLAINGPRLAKYVEEMTQSLKDEHEELSFLKTNLETLTGQTTAHLAEAQKEIESLADMLKEDEVMLKTLFKHFHRLNLQTHNMSRMIHELQCNQETIPHFVQPHMLYDDLSALQKKLSEEHKYTLTIPLQALHQYYQLEVARCTTNANFTTAVVMAPIQKSSSEWTAYEVHNLAFQVEPNVVCSVDNMPPIMAVEEQTRRIYAFSETDLLKCNPYDSRAMCYIPQYPTQFHPMQKCLETLYFSPNIKDIMRNCPYQCQNITHPIVQMIRPQEYLITNIDKIHVKCPNGTTEQTLTHSGALLVSMPCDCKIYTGFNLLVDSVFPCVDTWDGLSVQRVVPALYSKKEMSDMHSQLKKIEAHDFGSFFTSNLSDLESLQATIRNHTIKPVTLESPSIDSSYYLLKHENMINAFVLYFWLIMLTGLSGYLFITLRHVENERAAEDNKDVNVTVVNKVGENASTPADQETTI